MTSCGPRGLDERTSGRFLLARVDEGHIESYLDFLIFSEGQRRAGRPLDQRLTRWLRTWPKDQVDDTLRRARDPLRPEPSANWPTRRRPTLEGIDPGSILAGATGDPERDFELAAAAIERSGVPIERDCQLFGQLGRAAKGRIKLTAITDPLHRLEVLLHEHAHVLHPHHPGSEGMIAEFIEEETWAETWEARLRFEDGERQRETKAESASYVVMRLLGYDSPHAASYIAGHWFRFTDELEAVLTEIDRAVARITAALSVPA